MNSIVITGGAGFIGAHLAGALAARGDAVVIADNFERGIQDDFLRDLVAGGRVSVVHADLQNPQALDPLGTGHSHVVHLAAIVGVAHVRSRPYDVLTRNILLTDHAMQFARRQRQLRRFVFASTSEIMAGSLIHLGIPLPTPEDQPVALTDLAEPRTSYMLSKAAGESMCHYSGLPFTIIRPHNVYGPRMGMAHVVPELARKMFDARDGETLSIASADQRRAMCYIDDAVELIVRLMESPAALNGVFNVGNQQTETSILELAEAIRAAVGRPLRLSAGTAAAHSPSRRCPDMTRTIEATGYTPRFSIADGVNRTVAWYRASVFEVSGACAE